MFIVSWWMPLFGFIHLIQREKLVFCNSWEDACRVASVVEGYGYDVSIERDYYET